MSFLYRLMRLYWRIRRPTTLGSRVLVFFEKKILLVRLTYYPGWCLPGGGVSRGESFLAAARRELREEVGLEAHDLKLHGLYFQIKEGKRDHIAVYRSDSTTGQLKLCKKEISEAHFFSIDQLPKSVLPGHRRRIEEALQSREVSESW